MYEYIKGNFFGAKLEFELTVIIFFKHSSLLMGKIVYFILKKINSFSANSSSRTRKNEMILTRDELWFVYFLASIAIP